MCWCSHELAAPLILEQYMALSGPEPTLKLAYGSAASQYVELFIPPGRGPFPVVLLVHGGCWRKEFQGITQMRNIAGALLAQGTATCNVEYRRVDEDGGGYPGTYRDAAAALELLIAEGAARHLDTSRLVAMGHSAGGHLVQWLAGRRCLPPFSPLYQAQAAVVKKVIALGSIGDLRNRANTLQNICGLDPVQLTGQPTPDRPDVYSDTSPAELMPNGSTTVLINGTRDRISPPQTAFDYAQRALAAGDVVSTLLLPHSSHFDEVCVASPDWHLILPVILGALGEQTP